MYIEYALTHLYPHRCIFMNIFIYLYSKTSLNHLTMGLTLNGPFGEVVSLGSSNIITMALYG